MQAGCFYPLAFFVPYDLLHLSMHPSLLASFLFSIIHIFLISVLMPDVRLFTMLFVAVSMEYGVLSCFGYRFHAVLDRGDEYE